MKKTSLLLGMTAVLFALGLVDKVQADVVLDQPNLKGSVGLTGTYTTQNGDKQEAFASGNVTVSWSGDSVSNPLSSEDTDYALRADLGKTLSLRAHMYSFASSGAQLTQSISEIPQLEEIPQDSPRMFNLARESGRIRGTVSVTNNSGSEGVTRFNMYSSAQVSTTESYSGSVVDTTTPFVALQPMPALENIDVRGSVYVRKEREDGSTCHIRVELSTQSVNVPVDRIVDVDWVIDMSQLTCPVITPLKTGNIQGNVMLFGLDGDNADIFSYQRVYAGGEYSNSLSTVNGSYSILSVPVGDNLLYSRCYFNSPYNRYLSLSNGNVSVAEGETTVYDFSQSFGTLHGKIIPNGIWGLDDVDKMHAYFNGTALISYYIDLANGQFDLVVPVGDEYLYRLWAYFHADNGFRTFSQDYYRYYNSVASPVKETLAVGDRLEDRNLELETSAIDQGIYLANKRVGIKRLIIEGEDYDPATGLLLGNKRIELTSNLTGDNATNEVIVPIYGEPGSYTMIAVADGDDGGTYRKEFTLELMSAQCTEAGYADPIDFITGAGGFIGSVQFDNVDCATTAGCTTINVSNIGPRPPENFKVYSNQSNCPNTNNCAEYYDIRTTIEFCGATVCFSYDDNQFNGNVQKEKNLKLAHYVCANDNCNWEKLSSTVDTDENKICGYTPSFSIFAIIEPLDQDSDGIFDSEDNCPETPNADQSDIDEDGYGDACDSDIDGDGIVDDEDRCPWIASQNNDDLDGDGLGDICDDDIDGDGIANNDDNCPFAENANQVDFDSDGKGDACDLDDDNDGIENSDDNCAGTQPNVLIDGSGCSSAQLFMIACPLEAAYKNHGKYVSCVAKEAERQLEENLITEELKGAAVSAAAHSDLGKKKVNQGKKGKNKKKGKK